MPTLPRDDDKDTKKDKDRDKGKGGDKDLRRAVEDAVRTLQNALGGKDKPGDGEDEEDGGKDRGV